VIALIISWATKPPKNAQRGGRYPWAVKENFLTNSLISLLIYSL
jgi:hypothetical protein